MESYLKRLFNLSDKIAVVTGAAGLLGGEYVKALLKAGAKVAAFDLNFRNSKAKIEKIKSKKLVLIETDITKKDSLKKGLKNVLSRLGSPNVLINNAAIDAPPGGSKECTGSFETYPEESWDKMIEVNLKGMFLSCQVIGSYMAKAGGGSIINIASIYGILSPDQGIYQYKARYNGKPFFKPIAYSVSKSGVLNLTRYLATYWAKRNVRVNALTPGGVFNNQDKIFVRNYSKRVPLGRMARQDEYNGAILFLASDASSYMTGSNLIIDGGYSSW